MKLYSESIIRGLNFNISSPQYSKLETPQAIDSLFQIRQNTARPDLLLVPYFKGIIESHLPKIRSPDIKHL